VIISGAPTERSRKLIFGGGAKPRRQKSIKEKRLYDGRLAFTPKLKHTRRVGCVSKRGEHLRRPYRRHKKVIFRGGGFAPRQKSLLQKEGTES
jgi:hypothetical protein